MIHDDYSSAILPRLHPMRMGQVVDVVDAQLPRISTPTYDNLTSAGTFIPHSTITRKLSAWEIRNQFGVVLVFAIDLFREYCTS